MTVEFADGIRQVVEVESIDEEGYLHSGPKGIPAVSGRVSNQSGRFIGDVSLIASGYRK